MPDNIYGNTGSGRANLADGADGAAASDQPARRRSGSSYKAQMVRSNIFLAAMFVVGAAVIYGLSLRKGPSEVEASTEQQIVEAQVNSAILRISLQEAGQIKRPASGRITRRILQTFYDQIAERQIPLDALRKDPFVFVSPRAMGPAVTEEPQDPQPAPAKTTEEEEYEKTMAAFKTLHLQSVMMGRNRTAIISNNLLTVGQEIEGFKVDSITPKSVVLTWRDRKFTLEMP